MRTTLSSRREKFYRLVRQAYEQPTKWLEEALKDPTRNHGRFNALARLACLRILACRETSGQPYLQRKKLVRQRLAI